MWRHLERYHGATVEEKRIGLARRVSSTRVTLVAAGTVLVLAVGASWFLLNVGQANPSGQLETDCVRDQQAISDALANADAGRLRDAATGNTILELTDQISEEQSNGLRTHESRKLSSIEVIQVTDPNDSGITQAVEEKGVLTRTLTASGVQSSQQAVNFDDKYWLRVPSGSRYAITDDLVAEQPVPEGPAPLWWVVAGAVLVAIVGAVLAVRERKRRVAMIAVAPASASIYNGSAAEGTEPTLRIETLGGLHIWVGGTDLAPKLKRHPMLCFIWIWLLLRAVHFDRPGMAKADLADEAYPGSNPETQRTRMRGRLSQIRTKLPAALGAVVLAEGDMVRFDLSGCSVDVAEMKRASEQLGSNLASAPDALLDAGLRLFQASQAEVLPEWDGIAWQIARGRGGADHLIRDVRAATRAHRSQLGSRLAEAYLRRGQSELAATIRSQLSTVNLEAD